VAGSEAAPVLTRNGAALEMTDALPLATPENYGWLDSEKDRLRQKVMQLNQLRREFPEAVAGLVRYLEPGDETYVDGVRYHVEAEAEGAVRLYAGEQPLLPPPGDLEYLENFERLQSRIGEGFDRIRQARARLGALIQELNSIRLQPDDECEVADRNGVPHTVQIRKVACSKGAMPRMLRAWCVDDIVISNVPSPLRQPGMRRPSIDEVQRYYPIVEAAVYWFKDLHIERERRRREEAKANRPKRTWRNPLRLGPIERGRDPQGNGLGGPQGPAGPGD
jgi:hypothetical protein